MALVGLEKRVEANINSGSVSCKEQPKVFGSSPCKPILVFDSALQLKLLALTFSYNFDVHNTSVYDLRRASREKAVVWCGKKLK